MNQDWPSLWSANEDKKKESNLDFFCKHLDQKKLLKYKQDFKYLWRCNYKDHKVQDLHKAKWYLAKLISIVDKDITQPMFNFDKNNTIEVTNEQ